jgi:pantothenate kinase
MTARRLSPFEFLSETKEWALGLDGRAVLAIAGAPGSGKSTLAETLVDLIESEAEGTAAILPMDGFHYDDMVLVPRGWRPRKGAPHTFDVAGFATALQRLRDPDGGDVAVPVFDRDLEIARAGARIIPESVRLIVTEGNYLLLDHPDWVSLRKSFDRSVFMDVAMDELTRRLTARWETYSLSESEISAKLEENDLPNARTVTSESVEPDVIISS